MSRGMSQEERRLRILRFVGASRVIADPVARTARGPSLMEINRQQHLCRGYNYDVLLELEAEGLVEMEREKMGSDADFIVRISSVVLTLEGYCAFWREFAAWRASREEVRDAARPRVRGAIRRD